MSVEVEFASQKVDKKSFDGCFTDVRAWPVVGEDGTWRRRADMRKLQGDPSSSCLKALQPIWLKLSQLRARKAD